MAEKTVKLKTDQIDQEMEKTNNLSHFFLVLLAEIKSFLLLDQIEKGISVGGSAASPRQIPYSVCFLLMCHRTGAFGAERQAQPRTPKPWPPSSVPINEALHKGKVRTTCK